MLDKYSTTEPWPQHGGSMVNVLRLFTMMAIEVYIPTHNIPLEQAMHFLHVLTLIAFWMIVILPVINQ